MLKEFMSEIEELRRHLRQNTESNDKLFIFYRKMRRMVRIAKFEIIVSK